MTNVMTITDNAAARITHLLQKEPAESKLRIAVDGGGCSGFQYSFNFVQDTPAKDDVVVQNGEAVVLVDAMSAEYIGGSELDYIETLGAAHFSIQNPNATASCGCGNSFAL